MTFLFTDVEGSTRLLRKLGQEGYASALADHRRLLREAFARHGGVEVEVEGEEFFVAFSTAPGALAAARDLTVALGSGPVRVRVGVHTGTPLLTEEGYVGVDVHRAARIAAAGHGGQVLVSASTAALVQPRGLFAQGVVLVDLREHRFKDLAIPERVFQLGDGEFPPLRSLYRTNLPVPATAFLGRAVELAEVTALLARADVRLLTLTGPGGMGKTRLALQAAAEVSDRYPDGVFWAGLGALRDPELVLPIVSEQLGAEQELAKHVGDRRLLLLLDNFEQVVEAAGEAASLITVCPHLDLLVTSRQPLHVLGEWVYAVPPLVDRDASSLFLERAHAVGSDFAADGAVDEICRRLDGMPLAIELAAARVSALSPAAILARLDRRLPLLTGGPRDVPERQRTLRATIEWSYELLSGEERRLFARLAVFVGGCTLDAVEQVCESDLETLSSLVDKSLVCHRGDRYWLLETIREHALERFEEQQEPGRTTRALADYLLALLERGRGVLETDEDPTRVLDRLPDEIDNLRTAVEWALAAPEPQLALQLVAKSGWFQAVPSERSRWHDQGLRHANLVSPRMRADALRHASVIKYRLGDLDKAAALAEQSLRLCREHTDDAASLEALRVLAVSVGARGEYGRAQALQEECLELATRLGDGRNAYQAIHGLGEIERRLGNYPRALQLLERSETLAREAGDRVSLAEILHAAGDVALAQHDPAQAGRLYREALRLDRELKAPGLRGVTYCVAGLAAVAATTGHTERAGRLSGGLEILEHEIAWPVPSHDRSHYEEAMSACSHAAPVAFAAGAEQGRRMTPEEVRDYALSD